MPQIPKFPAPASKVFFMKPKTVLKGTSSGKPMIMLKDDTRTCCLELTEEMKTKLKDLLND